MFRYYTKKIYVLLLVFVMAGAFSLYSNVTAEVCSFIPTVTSISPTSTLANSSDFTLTVYGTNFMNTSGVYFGGSSMVTSYVSSTELTATIPASQLLVAGTKNVTVFNPKTCGRVDDFPKALGVSPNGSSLFVYSDTASTLQKFDSSTMTKTTSQSAVVNSSEYQIAVSPDNNYIYVTSGDTLKKFNVSTLALLGTVNTGSSPRSVAISSDGNYVYVANYFTRTIQKFNSSTLSLVSSVNTVGKPQFLVSNGGFLYITTYDDPGTSTYNVKKYNDNLGLVATSPALTSTPRSLVVSPDGSNVYVGYQFNLAKLDGSTLTQTAVGTGGPATNMVISQDGNFLYFFTTLPNLVKYSTSTLSMVASADPAYFSGGIIPSAVGYSLDNFNIESVYATGYQASGQGITSTGFIKRFNTALSLTAENPTDGGMSNAKPFDVNNPVPTITTISPDTKTVGSAQFTLTVTGTNFVSNSTVNFAGSARTTTFVSSTQLTATIPASDLTVLGTYDITVFNPSPGGGTSNAKPFTVGNPIPTISSLSPSSKMVGDPGFTLTVNGTNFITNSVIYWSGLGLTTTYVSTNQLTTFISSVPTAGDFSITVVNPAPGGGTSNAKTFTVQAPNPVPTLTNINPNTKNVGDVQFTMTVTGTNFVSASVVRLAGADRSTTFVNSTQLTATIPASDMATGGTFAITVFNPTPGGGTSGSVNFTVNNLVPTTTSISPNIAGQFDPQFIMTVNGTNFVSTSVVRFNGSDRTTTYVNGTQLTATIPASDMFVTGSFPITVFNQTPGGGTSNSQTFSVVVGNPVPTITSISPSSANLGEPAFTFTVTGTNFIAGSVIMWESFSLTTTYVSDTTLTTTLGPFSTGGAFDVTVVNPAPGGGTSNIKVFSVNNPVPTLTSISPEWKTVGAAQFTMTFVGTNFVPNSVVRFAGSDRATSYISSTQATATILASDLLTPGLFDIAVFNPAPGGGISNTQPFIVNPANAGSIKVKKTANGGNDTFSFTTSGTGYNPFNIITANGQGYNVQLNLAPGSYSAVELPPLGWTQDSSDCMTLFVMAGQTAVCNVVNTSTGQSLPHIDSLTPNSVAENSGPFTLIVDGSNFIPSSEIHFDGLYVITTYVSPTRLTTNITTIPPLGVHYVTVVNPGIGGGTSNEVPFTVTPAGQGTPPTATNLAASSDRCPVLPAQGVVYFSWNYNDINFDLESKFQIQVDNNSDFSSPEVDRTFSNLSNPSGTLNQQAVTIKLSSTDPTTPGCDFINYGNIYYWRVKVWEQDPAIPSQPGLDSGWVSGNNYTTITSPGPYADFTSSPSNPAPLTPVQFANTSICYGPLGQVPCSSYDWAFGDGGTSTLADPEHTYATTGAFPVTLKAFDLMGYCQVTKNVSVTEGNSVNGLPYWKEISPF